MKSLKFDQNLIVVLAYKQLSNSVPKYKIITSTLNNLSPFGQKEEILINENNLGNIIKDIVKIFSDFLYKIERNTVRF